jgi:hypothetical protein
MTILAPGGSTTTGRVGDKSGAGSVLTILDQPDHPLIKKGDLGTEENEHGFEGGSVVKLNGTYHLFTSEMVGDPLWVKMKLAHWTSRDERAWKRVSTLYESSGNFDGTDPRAALWAPMPVFNYKDDHWELFYVAYRSQPDTAEKWLINFEGRIWRAVSTRPGVDGIGGPYKDVGVVLEPGKDSDPWEGLQGTDSFYPFRVGDRWYGFYGSAKTEVKPVLYWKVGLVSAPALSGPWKRLSAHNPVPLDSQHGVETPIVTRLKNGLFIAVFDSVGPTDQIGYALSEDGVEWGKAKYLLLDRSKLWTSDVRTPLGLIPEDDGTFTLFYTGYLKESKVGVLGGLGMLTLELRDK